VTFRNELASNPDSALAPDSSLNTVWNLWRASSQLAPKDRHAGWDRPFLEGHFGRQTVDRIRDALRPVWRTQEPTLRSEREQEKRNTQLVIWDFGLAAVFAEAEDPQWATKLSPDEARLACRFAIIKLNGFPTWLDDLVQAHPAAVDDVLGAELSRELGCCASDGYLPDLLRDIGNGSRIVGSFFKPRVRDWLVSGGDKARPDENAVIAVNRLDAALSILLKDASASERDDLLKIALDRLKDGLWQPRVSTWLPLVMTLDPEVGTSVSEGGLQSVPSENPGAAVELIAACFGHLDSPRSVLFGGAELPPRLLLRLV